MCLLRVSLELCLRVCTKEIVSVLELLEPGARLGVGRVVAKSSEGVFVGALSGCDGLEGALWREYGASIAMRQHFVVHGCVCRVGDGVIACEDELSDCHGEVHRKHSFEGGAPLSAPANFRFGPIHHINNTINHVPNRHVLLVKIFCNYCC